MSESKKAPAKMGRPRKSKNAAQKYSVRLDPDDHKKIISKHGTLRDALEYLIKKIS